MLRGPAARRKPADQAIIICLDRFALCRLAAKFPPSRQPVEGGQTKLANLTLLCRGHHRMVHQGLIRIEPAPDGGFVFYDRWGRLIPDHGEPLGLTGPSLEERRATLDIDSQTCRPEWYGDPLDTYATDVIVEHHQALEAGAHDLGEADSGEENRARYELEHRARAREQCTHGDPPERPPGPFEPPQRPPS